MGVCVCVSIHEDVSKSFRTGRRLARELQMVQLFATRCSCIAILWVSLLRFAAITLCVASKQVFIVVIAVYFLIDSVRKFLDTPSYVQAPSLWIFITLFLEMKSIYRRNVKILNHFARSSLNFTVFTYLFRQWPWNELSFPQTILYKYPCEHCNEPSGSIKDGTFLTSWVTVSFSRRILLHGVS
jgi:hypothetical protein